MSAGYPGFRRKLDAVLRQRDPRALRAFLVGEGQWDAETTTDPERAMWMMIATSPALASLHEEAIAWLATHGYAEEARTLGRGGGGPLSSAPSPPRGGGAGRGGRHGGRPPGGPPRGGSGTGPHGGRPNSGHGKPGGPSTPPHRPSDKSGR